MRILLFGTFDRLHPGHEFVLREAMKRGDVTAVIARDRNVERIKGRAPKQTEEERIWHLRRAFPGVHAMLGSRNDFLAPVREVQPDLILLGYDQRLPPGITEADIGVPMERLPALEPEKYKSSIVK